VLDFGGGVLASPDVVPIVFQSDDPAMIALIGDLTTKMVGSAYWSSISSEYGVGDLKAEAPMPLAELPQASITPQAIETWLKDKLDTNDPALPPPNAGSIYAIFYPSGVTVGDPGSESCIAFGGYHSSIVLDAAHGSKAVPYAVIPRCATFAGLDANDTLTVTTSHEIIEAATDPLPLSKPAYVDIDSDHHSWIEVYGGGEVADMCNLPEAQGAVLPGTSHLVQRSWSNAAALLGHDPCIPTLPSAVYFNASPELPDDVTLAGGIMGKGVKMAVGETRTIPIHIFSEGPTAPIKVVPEDFTEITGGTKQLELTLDQDTALNGQTLHLTIHVIGSKKEQLFRISSFEGGGWNYWIGAVGR
jgi:hypothetical protein